MAHIRCDFRSEVLDMNTSMTVVLPEGIPLGERPVCYAFHGLQDNCTGISRYTSVERYVRKYQAALVIPEVQRSFYIDMAYGLRYFTFIHDELPKICQGFFGLSGKPENNYLMGISMGGYGALKCVLRTPERYGGVAALSPSVSLGHEAFLLGEQFPNQVTGWFGIDGKIPEEDNLFALTEKADPARTPRIFMACGEQDPFLEPNSRLVQCMQRKGMDVTFRHWEGDHGWAFWDRALEQAIDFLLGGRA